MNQVVWFKRDLRIHDHPAFFNAAAKGDVLPLVTIEPNLWKQPDLSQRHYQFFKDSIRDLKKALHFKCGLDLLIKVGEAVEVLQHVKNTLGHFTLWSHQETWNDWTYQRDIVVEDWARLNRVRWEQPQDKGVVRKLASRDNWANQWHRFMMSDILSVPQVNGVAVNDRSDCVPELTFFLKENKTLDLQQGGREQAIQLLSTFFDCRGEFYSRNISSPLTSFASCSRLSPHIAFGTVSVREVFQQLQRKISRLRRVGCDNQRQWLRSLKAFGGRLRWHCHFIQKLEDEPGIEFNNFHPYFNGLRENEFNQNFFDLWSKGETGYPIVDACMRSLTETGWLNFRMRAMLVSFSSYHLWLHWRQPALHLARLFTDYEPGIHYSQIQMQSGTTGINTLRVYNPLKQSQDQDAFGVFIKRWVPELEHVPHEFIHTPWLYPGTCHYPDPLVPEDSARKTALKRIFDLRASLGFKQQSKKVVKKHGSRKGKVKKKTHNNQLELF